MERAVLYVKPRPIVVLAVALAIAVTAIGLWRRPAPIDSTEPGASAGDASAEAGRAGVSPTPAPTNLGQPAVPGPIDPAWRTPSSPSPHYAEPEEIETLLGQFFAEQRGLQVVSLSSIRCGATACEVALSGTEVNPRYVDAYHDLYEKLIGAGWSDFVIRTSALGTRELAPGAREYVISFEYQPLVNLSADPLIAARQYAACAAAWRRATVNPAPDDVVRSYLDQAEHYVALAASVLGEREASRVAMETRGGPVIRDCGAP